MICNFKSTLTTSTYKNNKGNLKTTTSTDTHRPTVDIYNDIETLENENKVLEHKLSNIKLNEKSKHQKRMQHLRKIHQCHGYYLRQRINKLNSSHSTFLQHLQQRINLSDQNTAFILEQETKLTRQDKLQSEKERLVSTDKIHNFTNLNLPNDFTNLLNKGTNYIPTSEHFTTSSIKETVTSEVNSALCQLIKRGNSNNLKMKSKRTNTRHKPYTKQNPIKLLKVQQSQPNFNLHLIDYVLNTTSYTKIYLQSNTLQTIFKPQHLNITPSLQSYIHTFYNRPDVILTKSDKNVGWALVPISWFTNEYTRHFNDSTTYRQVDNFNFTATISNSNKLQKKLKLRFDKLLTPNQTHLLNPVSPDLLQLPYMKLLPKVHKLNETPSTDNFNTLTGRPIITAHSWITSNPSRLLGNELDNIILQLKELFKERDIPFPLIYNSTDLIHRLQKFNIDNLNNYNLTTFDFTSLYTNISGRAGGRTDGQMGTLFIITCAR